MKNNQPKKSYNMKKKPTEYLWQRKDGDRLHGFFDSIELAVADAAREAKEVRELWPIIVWDTRAARKSDAKIFEGTECSDGSTVDTTKPRWYEGRYVPVNIVSRCTVP